MKYLAMTAALMLGSTALAQTTPPSTPAMPGAAASPPSDAPAMPSPETTAPVDPATAAPPEAPTSPPMTTAPDAMASPATPSATVPDPAMAQAPAAPISAQTSYPPCSRTVVDQCIQGSARERNTKRRARRG